MAEEKNNKAKPAAGTAGKTAYGQPGQDSSVYAQKKRQERSKNRRPKRGAKPNDEFDQRIVDIARVTRVMAGGKRMRFRACVAIGNKKGKVAVGIDKGADVTMAVTKAVNKAKKNFIEVPIINDTIPHAIYHKFGAAKVLLKPARRGKGVIAGGAVRIVMELAGIKNITSKILGTNNNINVAKCAIAALASLKKIEPREKKDSKDKDNTIKDKKSKNMAGPKDEKSKPENNGKK